MFWLWLNYMNLWSSFPNKKVTHSDFEKKSGLKLKSKHFLWTNTKLWLAHPSFWMQWSQMYLPSRNFSALQELEVKSAFVCSSNVLAKALLHLCHEWEYWDLWGVAQQECGGMGNGKWLSLSCSNSTQQKLRLLCPRATLRLKGDFLRNYISSVLKRMGNLKKIWWGAVEGDVKILKSGNGAGTAKRQYGWGKIYCSFVLLCKISFWFMECQKCRFLCLSRWIFLANFWMKIIMGKMFRI